MSMARAQAAAFKAASGDLAPDVLHLICLGLLFGFLFWWVAWVMLDVWSAWSRGRVEADTMGRAVFRAMLLLVVSLWMFGS